MAKNNLISKIDTVLKSKKIFWILIITIIFTFVLIFFLQTYENKKIKDRNNSNTHYTQSIEGDKN